MADETRLRQLLINLLNNAVKFTDNGGITLRVASHHSAEESVDTVVVVFEVQDTGVGIEPDKKDQIFDPFVQDKAGIRSGEGTGLGLPISRKIARLMNGDITVESEAGNGTIFSVHIQLNQLTSIDGYPLQATKRVVGLHPNHHNRVTPYRMLIVDDIESNRILLHTVLAPLDFDIRIAENGQRAIEIWEECSADASPLDLIWMDIRTPVIDGFEATRTIKRMAKKKGQHPIIIAVSASVFDQDIETILSKGFDDFVRKPFKESEIFEKMRHHLGLQYVYEESNNRKKSESVPGDDAIYSKIHELPLQWRESIIEAVTLLDHDAICSFTSQIRDQHPAFAQMLQKEIDQFNYNKILEMIDK